VRDERNLAGRDIALRKQCLNAGNDAGRHPLVRRVSRWNLDAGYDRARLRVDRDDIRERSPNVDS